MALVSAVSFADDEALTLANIKSNGEVQFAQVGRALIERLGRSVDEIQDWAEEDTKTLSEVYRAAHAPGSRVTS